jgi:LmbE family N-acetylglucosaminyl deacetylase
MATLFPPLPLLSGIRREGETVAGMSLLGLGERHIIFLGYGDLSLPQLYDSTSSTTVFTSSADQSQTYASRGLGGTDYHNYLHRVHGAYNRASLLGDVEAVLQTFKPEEIYTTNSWDAHPDHQATLLFIVEAMQDLRNRGMNCSPKLFESIIHAPSDGYGPGANSWPSPPFTPLLPFAVPHGLAGTPLDWNRRINFPVPPSMQDPNPATNLKERVVSAYKTQNHGNPRDWLFSFVKKNEFFWVSLPSESRPRYVIVRTQTRPRIHRLRASLRHMLPLAFLLAIVMSLVVSYLWYRSSTSSRRA